MERSKRYQLIERSGSADVGEPCPQYPNKTLSLEWAAHWLGCMFQFYTEQGCLVELANDARWLLATKGGKFIASVAIVETR